MQKFILIFQLIITISYLYPQHLVRKTNLTYSNQSIFDLPKINVDDINIGLWALIIAKEFDETVDVQANLKKLEKMLEEINKMLAGRSKDMDKFLAVKMFIYEAGEWNNFTPFTYDLNDPLGKNLENQLLSSYLDSRKGNCVSMPTYFLSLMEQVAPETEFVGVKAPLHLFCRLRDKQTGDVYNVETTNGGNPARNQYYIDQMKISDEAVKSGLFLRDLSKKEYLAELMTTLVSKERRNGNFDIALKYTELILELSPNSELGLVNKGALLSEIGNKKSEEGILSEDEKDYYSKESKKYIDKASSLGWKPESKEDRENYMKSVKSENEKIEVEKR